MLARMIKMRVVLIVLMFIAVCLSNAYAQSTARKHTMNTRQKGLVSHEIERLKAGIEGDLWGPACYEETLAPWLFAHYLSIDDLIAVADTHDNANVRAVAVWCLMERAPHKSKKVFFRHVIESDKVNINGGCVPYIESLGDFLMHKAYELNYLNRQEYKYLDSVLLFSASAYGVSRRNEIVKGLESNPDNMALMRKYAMNANDYAAINYLVYNKELRDTVFVINALQEAFRPENVARRNRHSWIVKPLLGHAVYLMESWPHPAFKRHLSALRDTIVSKNGFVPSTLFSCAFVFDSAWIMNFVNESFALVATHPDNDVTSVFSRGKLVGRTAKEMEVALRFEGFEWDGNRRALSCCFVIPFQNKPVETSNALYDTLQAMSAFYSK